CAPCRPPPILRGSNRDRQPCQFAGGGQARRSPGLRHRRSHSGARSPLPARPFVTSAGRPASQVARIEAALQRAFSDPALAEMREALLLTGLSVLSDDDYERIVELERETEAIGGLTLWR